MTPLEKTKNKQGAQERAIPAIFKTDAPERKEIETNYYVEGYAAKFEPYILYKDFDGEPVYEAFDRHCFDNADMSDVILQFDHCGKVYARTGNGSLVLRVDDIGLHIAADLSRTEAARELYNEISEGMITKMSWRFSVGEYEWDEATRTITHTSVPKVWDCSAVSIPANDNTEINARSFSDGVIAEAARRDAELDDIRARALMKIKILKTQESKT